MAKSLSTAIVAGYVAIAVQTLTGVIFVPFLVSGEGVGLTGFATIATLQAALSLVAVLFDGYRQHVARVISHAAIDGTCETLSSIFRFILLLATAAVVPWVIGSPVIFKLIGITVEHVVAVSCLVAACMVLEQVSYVLECHQHAIKRSWIPSSLGGLDSLLRAILTVILFIVFSSDVFLFFLAAFVGQSLKLAFLLLLSPVPVRLVDSDWVEKMSSQSKAFVESFPLALNGIAPFVVFRGSVILANIMLVGEAAGVIAIILVTLRAYVNQGLFSVLRPMLIPRLALFDLREKDSVLNQRLLKYFDAFQFSVLLVGVLAVTSTPLWFSLWLGPAVKDYVLLAQVALTMYFLEIAYGAQYSCLIAHNNGRSLAALSGVFALLSTMSTVVSSHLDPNVHCYVGPVVGYLGSYVIAVRRIFGKCFNFPLRQSDLCTALFVLCIAASIFLMTKAQEVSGLSSLCAMLFWGCCHVGGNQNINHKVTRSLKEKEEV